MATDLYGYVSYLDPGKALEWLGRVGFVVLAVQDDDAGRLMHAEVRLGDAIVMLGAAVTPPVRGSVAAGTTGQGFYLRTDEVDELFRRAVDGGARPVLEPEDMPWGGRRARVLDAEGVEWTFGTYTVGAV